MKKYAGIIIDMAHADALQAEIDTVQKRVRTRTITVTDIIKKCDEVSRRLDISRKALEGVAFYADINAQSFPGAYNGIPESTHFQAAFMGGKWRLIKVYRYPVSAPTMGTKIQLTDAAKIAVLARITEF